MRCLHVNIRQAAFILLSIIVNNVNITQMVEQTETDDSSQESLPETENTTTDIVSHCPSDVECKDLPPSCVKCDYNVTCHYGKLTKATCKRLTPDINCAGAPIFERSFICRYCYQTENWEHTCDLKANCNSVASPRMHYTTNCTVKSDVLCFGNRIFNKNVLCNWTGGYRWTTALILSITLGGFGADRFYLGHWQEGIGKLFSFGGLGVWTIIDVILISLHYLGPADGSLYI